MAAPHAVDSGRPPAPGKWPVGTRWLVAAAGVAGLDALPSLYWASGGTALAWTIGDWAVEAWNRNPLLASAGLFLVAAVKLIDSHPLPVRTAGAVVGMTPCAEGVLDWGIPLVRANDALSSARSDFREIGQST